MISGWPQGRGCCVVTRNRAGPEICGGTETELIQGADRDLVTGVFLSRICFVATSGIVRKQIRILLLWHTFLGTFCEQQ